MMNLSVRLRDRNAPITSAWTKHFAGLANVEISTGDIFDITADAIVSPANSFGFMDGGIDLVYSQRFGWELQERLQEKIREEHYGDLPVGHAVVVATYDDEIPFLVSAPTMRIPMDVSKTINAYLAFKAALESVRRFNAQKPDTPIRTLLCPGLGTAVGRMKAEDCAKQMAAAYAAVALCHVANPPNLGSAVDEHYRLIPNAR